MSSRIWIAESLFMVRCPISPMLVLPRTTLRNRSPATFIRKAYHGGSEGRAEYERAGVRFCRALAPARRHLPVELAVKKG